MNEQTANPEIPLLPRPISTYRRDNTVYICGEPFDRDFALSFGLGILKAAIEPVNVTIALPYHPYMEMIFEEAPAQQLSASPVQTGIALESKCETSPQVAGERRCEDAAAAHS